MAFTMGGNGFGVICAIMIGALIVVGLKPLAFALTAAKQARDDVIEQNGDDPAG